MRDQKVNFVMCWGGGPLFSSLVCSEKSDFYQPKSLFVMFWGGGPFFEAQCAQRNLTFTAGPAVKTSTVLPIQVFYVFVFWKSALPGQINMFLLCLFCTFLNMLGLEAPNWSYISEFVASSGV